MFRSRLIQLRPVALFFALSFLSAAPLPAQTSQAVVTNRIVQPVNENSRVTLHGYIHPLANAADDRGAAPDSMPVERMHLVLKRSASQEATLHQLISDMHTPGSASYHKWLTPDQFGQQFGPSDQDLATVESWLASHGFEITGVKPGRQEIEFSGNVAQLRDTFHAQIHQYVVKGETHYATATNPQIPAALAPVISGFTSLNNFHVERYSHPLGSAEYNPKTDKATPQWTIGGNGSYNFVLSPKDFGVQYDLPNPSLNTTYSGTTYDGTGQTIAIINDSNINVALVNQFRSLFGLSNNPPQVVIDGNDPGIDGNNNPDGPNGDSIEAYLDVEWAGAVAPGATVDLVIGADTALESGLYLAAEHAVYANVAPVISISFGACEMSLGSTNEFFNALWEQAAAQGITVMVSSGDNGSAGCDNDNSQYFAVDGQQVNGFASTPWNVAVGGTDFYYSDYASGGASVGNYWSLTPSNTNPAQSIKGVIPEQPWNNSQYGLNLTNYYDLTGYTTIAAGSGGASNAAVCSAGYDSTTGACTGTTTGYAKPAWQSGTGVPADKVRDLPDVSLFAADGFNASYYPECYADGDCQPATSGGTVQITGVGGTSASAPAFAGMMALVNEKYGRQGQADFVLYPLKTHFPAAFHDVTHGSNSVPCNISTVVTTSGSFPSTNCIAVSNPITVADPTYGSSAEGQIGSGTTPEYDATAGYNLATGLGTIDAANLLADWGNVAFKSSTTTLTSPGAGASYTHGTAVTVSGSVSGSTTPTGSIALMTDSPTPLQQGLGAFALTNGSFSSSIYYLPGGTYNIWAQYSGDGTNAPSASTKTQITVNPEASTNYFNVLNSATTTTSTVAVSSGSNVPYGTQLILTSQIYGTTFYNDCVNSSGTGAICQYYDPPTGTVTFADNGTTVNTAQLNAEGDAEFNGAFGIGTHSVTSSYGGDPAYKSSTGSAITFTVAKATPQIGIVSGGTTINILVENSSNSTVESSNVGAAIPGLAAPTGTVTVSSSPSGISGTLTLSPAVDPSNYFVDGVAAVTATAPGTYSVTVSYSGDANYAATTGTQSVTISSPSGVTSSISANATGSVSPTTSVTVTGTVTGKSGNPAPTGTVVFFSSGYQLLQPITISPGSGDSSSFSVNLSSQILFQGTNLITVQYSGDKVYAPSSTTLSAITSSLSDFSLTAASSIVSVPASGTGTTTIYATPINGFSGTVALACTVPNAPAGVSCSLSQTSVSLTASANAKLEQRDRPLLFVMGGGAALACVLLFNIPARRRAWRNLLGLVVVACVLGLGIGCGGGSSSSSTGGTGGTGGSGGSTSATPSNPTVSSTLTITTSGATAGNYSILVTGSSTATDQVHTAGVTATVQ